MIDLCKPNFSFYFFGILLHKIPHRIMVSPFSIRGFLVRKIYKIEWESFDTNHELLPNMYSRCQICGQQLLFFEILLVGSSNLL